MRQFWINTEALRDWKKQFLIPASELGISFLARMGFNRLSYKLIWISIV